MWYAASVFFKGVHSPPIEEREPLWEESIRLIEAEDDDAAVAKAEHIGRSSEHSYATENGTLAWKFEHVLLDSVTISELAHGAELFSRFVREGLVQRLLAGPFDDD